MSSVLFDPIKTQASITDSVIVGFSGGKESVVVLDLCFKYFKNVFPYFMYVCPGLEFQERALRWYEERYGTEIYRMPHFEVSNFLKYGTFRPFDFSVDIVGMNDVYAFLRQKTGYEWVAGGERCADSIVLNAMIKKSGSVDHKRKRFFPLAYWKRGDVLQYIKHKKLYLSPEQRKLGRSFGALEADDLVVIKEMYPDDYERIKKLYPLVEAAIVRREYVNQ